MMTPDHEMESRSNASSQEFDYERCRCENNGDHCDYCAGLLQDLEDLLERENSETI